MKSKDVVFAAVFAVCVLGSIVAGSFARISQNREGAVERAVELGGIEYIESDNCYIVSNDPDPLTAFISEQNYFTECSLHVRIRLISEEAKDVARRIEQITNLRIRRIEELMHERIRLRMELRRVELMLNSTQSMIDKPKQ